MDKDAAEIFRRVLTSAHVARQNLDDVVAQ